RASSRTRSRTGAARATAGISWARSSSRSSGGSRESLRAAGSPLALDRLHARRRREPRRPRAPRPGAPRGAALLGGPPGARAARPPRAQRYLSVRLTVSRQEARRRARRLSAHFFSSSFFSSFFSVLGASFLAAGLISKSVASMTIESFSLFVVHLTRPPGKSSDVQTLVSILSPFVSI